MEEREEFWIKVMLSVDPFLLTEGFSLQDWALVVDEKFQIPQDPLEAFLTP